MGCLTSQNLNGIESELKRNLEGSQRLRARERD